MRKFEVHTDTPTELGDTAADIYKGKAEKRENRERWRRHRNNRVRRGRKVRR